MMHAILSTYFQCLNLNHVYLLPKIVDCNRKLLRMS